MCVCVCVCVCVCCGFVLQASASTELAVVLNAGSCCPSCASMYPVLQKGA